MSTKVAAVIVTYNRLAKLKKAIASILEQAVDEVVVVNNKSTDDTQAWLESEVTKDSRLKVLNLEENTGGAGGFYEGTKFATEQCDVDWLLLYDDDAYPREDLIANFKTRAAKASADVGALTCGVYTPDGKIADFNRPGVNSINSPSGILKYFFSKEGPYLSYEDIKHSHDIHVDFSSFVGFFVKTEVIRNGLGYPKKELFIYCDDWMYSLELSKLGYRNYYQSDLVFYHDSNTFVASYDDQLWKKYYACRNAIYLYKESAGIFFPVVFVAKLLKWLLEVRLYKKKAEYFKTLFRAIFDSFKLKFTKDSNVKYKLCSQNKEVQSI